MKVEARLKVGRREVIGHCPSGTRKRGRKEGEQLEEDRGVSDILIYMPPLPFVVEGPRATDQRSVICHCSEPLIGLHGCEMRPVAKWGDHGGTVFAP